MHTQHTHITTCAHCNGNAHMNNTYIRIHIYLHGCHFEEISLLATSITASHLQLHMKMNCSIHNRTVYRDGVEQG